MFSIYKKQFKVALYKIAHKFSDNAVDTKPPTPFATGEKSPQSLRRSRNLSSPNFQDLQTAISKTTMVNTSSTESNPLDVKRKSLLNASYSSEEILLQAASSLQGLEGTHYFLTLFLFVL